jgi:hypothetical protein
VEPDHEIFQSWVGPYYITGPGPREIPINLPESDPEVFSHTRLINETLGPVAAVVDWPQHEGSGLDQNQPNPLGSRTSIRYHVPTPSRVTLKLYDESGREVRTLVDDYHRPGEYSIDVGVGNLPSGIYFYRLKVGALPAKARKMVIAP